MNCDKDTFDTATPAIGAEREPVCEKVPEAREAAEGEAAEPWVADVWLDGTPYDPSGRDPFDETRLPEDEGPPYPPGLIEPLSADLIDTARYLLRFILQSFWDSPRWMVWVGWVWQWRKFDFLDWLRPVELLLRRLVMIEALALLASQALPPRKPSAGKGTAEALSRDRKHRSPPVFDWRHPEGWKVAFSVIPRGRRPGPRRRYRRNPEIARFHAERNLLGFEKISSRYRRVLHPMLPLAMRLEAVIRVVTNPAPFARRAAFRLRNRPSLNADWLLVDPPRPRRPLATDALRMARDRARELYGPVCRLHWSSA